MMNSKSHNASNDYIPECTNIRTLIFPVILTLIESFLCSILVVANNPWEIRKCMMNRKMFMRVKEALRLIIRRSTG